MNHYKQLLKWLIENPQWLVKTHDTIFVDQPTDLKIFLAAKRILKSGKPISFESLKYALKKHDTIVEAVKYLENETSIDKATALLIREDLRHVALALMLRKGANIDMTDPKASKEYIKQLNELQLDDQPEELTQAISFKKWSQHIKPDNLVLDSGLPFLKETGSDFKVGDQISFLAPSNQFKSGVLAHITRHQIAVGRNVLFFSMEETHQSMMSRIGHGLLKMTPYDYEQLDENQLEQRFATFNLGELDVISGSTLYIEELQDIVNDLEEKNGYKYDYIVIDYSGQIKLKNSKKQAREDQEISEIFRQLKLIALNPNNPKIAVTAIQSNREGYNKKKMAEIDNTSSSMGGVHSADLMISLKYVKNPEAPHRETPADEKHDDVKGNVKMKVLKKRTGTIQNGDKFIFNHLACGNIRQQHIDWTNEQEANQWDTLFDTDI